MGNVVLVRGATGRAQLKIFVGSDEASGVQDLTGYAYAMDSVSPADAPSPDITVPYPGLGEVELYWSDAATRRLPPGQLSYTLRIRETAPSGDKNIIHFRCDVE